MKNKSLNILTILLIVFSLSFSACAGTVEAPTATKVLVIHSYHERWNWNSDIEAGIMEGFYQQGYESGIDYEIETFYMDNKKRSGKSIYKSDRRTKYF